MSAADLLEPADLSAFVARTARGDERVELLVKGARCAGCLGKIERGVGADLAA